MFDTRLLVPGMLVALVGSIGCRPAATPLQQPEFEQAASRLCDLHKTNMTETQIEQVGVHTYPHRSVDVTGTVQDVEDVMGGGVIDILVGAMRVQCDVDDPLAALRVIAKGDVVHISSGRLVGCAVDKTVFVNDCRWQIVRAALTSACAMGAM